MRTVIDERKHQFKRTLAMSLALLLAAFLLLLDRWYVDRGSLLKELEVHASVIGANAVAAVTFDDQVAAEEIVDTAAKVPGMLEAALYSVDGRRIAHYLRSGESEDLGERAGALGSECTWGDITVIAPVLMNRNPVGSIGLRIEMISVYLAVTRFLGGLLVVVTIALLFAHLASRNIRRQIAEAEAALRHMALIDRVTGLNNRYAFERELERIVALHRRDGQGSALLFIDLDGFKKVNDLHGHQNGDRVLAEVAERLRQTLRRGDVMARIGGDEFGVILANTGDADDVARVARALIQVASYPFMLDSVAVHTGFSIGIAMIPDDGDTAERLLNHADMAMFRPSKAGKAATNFSRSSSVSRFHCAIRSRRRCDMR